jgi:hypothetical protein
VTDATPAKTTPDVREDAAAVFCPACGYDLRGAPLARCPECGVQTDPDALRVSNIPWAHRWQVGPVRAFLRTVRLTTFGGPELSLEPARPQEPRDARAFHRVAASVVAAALLGLLAVALWAFGDDVLLLAIEPPSNNPFVRARDLPPWTDDLTVPWSAGAVLTPVLPLCLILLAFHLTGAQRVVFRLPTSTSIDRRRRARALSAYAAAPLTLLAPTALCVAGAVWVERQARPNFGDPTHPLRPVVIGLSLAAAAVTLLALTATLIRTGRWLARTRHCGVARAAAGAAELLAWWAAGLVVYLGLVPWLTGFLWIVIDSLR